MSLLDTASLIVTPNAVKEGKLYSVIPSDGSGDMSVTRATTATRVNSAGLVELVPYNFAQYSQDFTNGVWGVAGYGNLATIVANDTIAPDGTMTASKATFTAAGTQGRLIQSISTTYDAEYTASFYVKYGNKTTINLYTDAVVFGTFVTFNFTSNTITNSNNTYGSSVENVGNGWYRISFKTFAPSSTAQFGMITFDGEDGFVYLWGGQLELGATATTYQKTETRLNIPRLDYSNGTCPSLLVEPQRTNLQTFSEDFTNGAWAANLNATTSGNVTTSPNGINTADKIIEDTSNSQHFIGQTQSGLSGVAYTISVFAKASERNFLFLFEDSGGGRNAYFDLTNGTIGNVGGSASANIENFGNGWYRCSVTYTSSGTLIRYRIATALSNGVNSYTGNGTSGLFIWGAQIEAGNYSTSYIPTTSASVTRNADVISKTGISSLIGQTEGTLFVDLSDYIELDIPCLTIDNGTNDNRIVLFRESGTGYLSLFLVASGTPVAAVSTTSASDGKIAIAYNGSGFVMYRNGVQILTATSAVPSSMSAVRFNGRATNDFYTTRKIKSFALWQTRLDNATLASLTTL
jgi:hypothetical protein